MDWIGLDAVPSRCGVRRVRPFHPLCHPSMTSPSSRPGFLDFGKSGKAAKLIHEGRHGRPCGGGGGGERERGGGGKTSCVLCFSF